jgi:mRNA-degrading endonuclease RelE of RelBE toxin-antitoxin system
MIYRRSRRFRRSFQKLPKEIQEKAVEAFSLFQENRWHPSLAIGKLEGTNDIWYGRIDRSYRFTFEYVKDETTGETICRFRNIGPHNIIERSP